LTKKNDYKNIEGRNVYILNETNEPMRHNGRFNMQLLPGQEKQNFTLHVK